MFQIALHPPPFLDSFEELVLTFFLYGLKFIIVFGFLHCPPFSLQNIQAKSKQNYLPSLEYCPLPPS